MPAEGTLWVAALLQSGAAIGWLVTVGDPDRPTRLVLIGLASTALGIQSTLVARLALPGVSTTFVTGTMVAIGAYLRRAPGSPEVNWLRIVVFTGLLGGAAIGAGMLLLWRSGAMLLPAAGLWATASLTRGGTGLWPDRAKGAPRRSAT